MKLRIWIVKRWIFANIEKKIWKKLKFLSVFWGGGSPFKFFCEIVAINIKVAPIFIRNCNFWERFVIVDFLRPWPINKINALILKKYTHFFIRSSTLFEKATLRTGMFLTILKRLFLVINFKLPLPLF